jgi:hypothetical protein
MSALSLARNSLSHRHERHGYAVTWTNVCIGCWLCVTVAVDNEDEESIYYVTHMSKLRMNGTGSLIMRDLKMGLVYSRMDMIQLIYKYICTTRYPH